MARYTDAVCRQCRREGQKLFLKGEKCHTVKCPVTKRASAPGQHGDGRKKVSEYGVQLRAKQMAKRYYGVLEKQFATYFTMATKRKGIAGENLLIILESRFDNVVYRMGLASSRPEARQLVTHNHFTVNGKNANIPSMLLKEGDVIALKEGSKGSEKFKAIAESCGARPIPAWLDMDKEKAEAKILRMPTRDEIDLEVEEHLIVELYSK